jgi:hypothetical protein
MLKMLKMLPALLLLLLALLHSAGGHGCCRGGCGQQSNTTRIRKQNSWFEKTGLLVKRVAWCVRELFMCEARQTHPF